MKDALHNKISTAPAAMDSPSSPLDSRTIKAKKAALPAQALGPSTAPTTFFLKKEKDMEKSSGRGRTPSQSSSKVLGDASEKTPGRMSSRDSTFGVESLEDTIRTPMSSESSLSRSTSLSSERSSDGNHAVDSEGRILNRKRRSNRVHPSILAAGQRIISSEHRQTSLSASPASIPFTPTKNLRAAGSVSPSTPRSASPKSFRLSDEDSIADDHSQAVVSSSGDEDEHNVVERTPQLVMPSLPVTTRRPFTDVGRRLGRAKIMVIGPSGVGKTSFISSFARSTEHIVHVDELRSIPSHVSFNTENSEQKSTKAFTEIQASTRPYLSIWSNQEHKRPRSDSISSGVLERNLTFIDTPGLDDDEAVTRVLEYVKTTLRRTADFGNLSDDEVVSLLSGDGGVQIDTVMYLFPPTIDDTDSTQHGLTPAHQELLRFLCKYTNLIPVLSKSDTLTPEKLRDRKDQIGAIFSDVQAAPHKLSLFDDYLQAAEPLAVSSALVSDDEVIDASILMSSQYLSPLAPSELSFLAGSIFVNLPRMRHLSANKFVAWKREHMPRGTISNQAMFDSPYLRSQSPGVTSTGSYLEDPSKVLVPHSSSSYYRSASPAISDGSAPSGPCFALTKHAEQAQPTEPLREIRLAKWAQDLQRGLENERRKYREMYSHRPDDEEKNEKQALVPVRAAPGRLGGDLGVIDPRDPLGLLALSQRFSFSGFLALQLVGGCGLLGAAIYWISRNWIDVQSFLGLGQPTSTTKVPGMQMSRQGTGLFDGVRLMFGEQR